MIQSTITSNNDTSICLFDTGALHYFESLKHVRKHKCKSEPLGRELIINTPTGDKSTAGKICKNVPTTLTPTKDFDVCLVIMNMHDFNLILSIGWLTRHKFTINCAERTLQFSSPNGIKTTIIPNINVNLEVISLNKIKKYGCQLFQIYVEADKEYDLFINYIPVVKEYPDVFPNELPGLPPNC